MTESGARYQVSGVRAALVLLAAYCLLPAVVLAQNMTTFSASKIQDGAGNLLPSGVLWVQGTDANNTPISFQCGGGGQVHRAPFPPGGATVTNGAITSFSVCNPANTVPAGIFYHVWVVDSTVGSRTLGQKIIDDGLVQWVSSPFNFDNYVPTAAVSLPASGSLPGNLSVGGNGSFTGAISANNFPQLGNAAQVLDATTKGATFTTAIAAAAAAVPSAGGVIHAEGFGGSQTLSSSFTCGSTGPTVIYLPAGTISLTSGAQILLGNYKCTIIGQGKGEGGISGATVISGNSSSALIVSANYGAPVYRPSFYDFVVSNSGSGPAMDLTNTNQPYLFHIGFGCPGGDYGNSLVVGGNSTGSYYSLPGFVGVENPCTTYFGLNANSHLIEGGNFYRVVINGANSLTFLHPDFESASGFIIINGWGIHIFDPYFEGDSTVTPPAWVAGHAYVLGDKVRDDSSHYFYCSVAGTAGGSAPSWVTTSIGSATTDGGATWVFFSPTPGYGGNTAVNADVIFGLSAFSNILDGTGNQLFYSDVNMGASTNRVDFLSENQGESRSRNNLGAYYGLLFGSDPNQGETGSSPYWLHRDPYSLINGDAGFGLDVDFNAPGTLCNTYGYCGRAALNVGNIVSHGADTLTAVTIAPITSPTPVVTCPNGGGTTAYSFYLVERPTTGIYGSISSVGTSSATCASTPSPTYPLVVSLPALSPTVYSGNSKYDILTDSTHSAVTNVQLPGGSYSFTAALSTSAWSQTNNSGWPNFTGGTAPTSYCGSLSGATGCLKVLVGGTPAYVPYW